MVATWAKAVQPLRPAEPGHRPAAGDRRGETRFRIDADFRQLEQSDLPELRSYTASRKLFLTPGGQPLPVGYLLRNPDLARTYQMLAQHGPSYLYDGPLGQAIVARRRSSRALARPATSSSCPGS